MAPMEPPRSARALLRTSRRGLRVPAVALVATAAALLSLPIGPSRQVSGPLAASLFAAGGRPKVLFEYRDYELLYRPRRKGQFLPRIQLRKTPPRPLAAGPVSFTAEGPLDRDFAGFPFTTSNAGSVQLKFPRIAGTVKLGMEDPATGAASDDGEDEKQQAAEIAYEQQRMPVLGDVTLRGRSNGEWGASFSRQVEDLGQLSGSVNSQLDWSLDLDSTYQPVNGFTPSVRYGANQDGMRVRASVEGLLEKNLHGSYAVQNEAGQYSPEDFRHEAKLKLTSGRGRQALEAQGTYDRKLERVPVRGSLSYSAQLKPVTLEASVDFDRYRLGAKLGMAQVAAAMARKAEESGSRPAELQLKLGQVSATALLGEEKPRLRLGIGA